MVKAARSANNVRVQSMMPMGRQTLLSYSMLGVSKNEGGVQLWWLRERDRIQGTATDTVK